MNMTYTTVETRYIETDAEEARLKAETLAGFPTVKFTYVRELADGRHEVVMISTCVVLGELADTQTAISYYYQGEA